MLTRVNKTELRCEHIATVVSSNESRDKAKQHPIEERVGKTKVKNGEHTTQGINIYIIL